MFFYIGKSCGKGVEVAAYILLISVLQACNCLSGLTNFLIRLQSSEELSTIQT